MQSAREQNRLFIRGMWIRVFGRVAIVALLVAVAFALPQRGAGLGVLAGAAAFVFFVAAVSRWRAGAFERKLRKRLRSATTADDIVAFLERSLRDGAFPHVEAYRAQATSVMLGLYGREDDAWQRLESVAWGGRPPVVTAIRHLGEALVDIFAKNDVERALHAARHARALADVGEVPGAKAAEIAWATSIDACNVIRDADDHAARARLEHTLSNRPPVVLELLATWSLARAHRARGDEEAARRMSDRFAMLAPYAVQPLGTA